MSAAASPPPGPLVSAGGDRGVAIGGDADGSIINTGDGSVFVGTHVRLDDAIIDASSVFERVDVDRFVGRAWVDAEVDALLRERDRGVLVLEAAAGLGKSAYMAHLARSRGWIHHFGETARGEGGVGPALQSLAAQLVRAHGLQPHAARGAVPATATTPEFLASLLARAAERRAPDAPIVLVLDALDECGAPPGQNVLGLPRTLPRGVYLVCSQRPVAVRLTVTNAEPRVVRLDAESARNLADMRAFLVDAAARPKVARALAEGRRTAADFERVLLARCRGVWIYLQYVVAGIEAGQYAPLDLEALPYGVWQYYAEFWGRWRDDPRWHALVLPLLGTLGAVQEDLDVEELARLAGELPAHEVRALLDGAWRPFLTVAESGTQRRYRLYHASLRQFLDGRLETSERTTDHGLLAEALAGATRAAHARMADRALAAWGGLDAGLPALRGGQTQAFLDGYGRRHVVAHLVGAGRLLEAKRLLTSEWVREERREIRRSGWRGALDRLLRRRRHETTRTATNAWYATRADSGDVAGYLADVERVGRAAREHSARALARGEPAPSIALEVRAALMAASVGAVAGNVGPRLLEALVRERVLDAPLASVYARQTPDAVQRVHALLRVAPALDAARGDEAFRLALAALLEVPRHARPEALRGVPPGLPTWVVDELLRTVRDFADEDGARWQEPELVAALLPALPDDRLPAMVERALAAGSLDRGPLAALVPRLAPAARDALLDALLDAPRVRAEGQAGRGEAWELARALLPAAAALPEPRRAWVVQVVHERIAGDRDGRWQTADDAAHLLPHLAPAARDALGRSLLRWAEAWPSHEVVSRLGPLLALLPDGSDAELERMANARSDDHLRREIVRWEVARLAGAGRFDEALAAAESLGPGRGSHYPSVFLSALSALADAPAPVADRAFALACAESDAEGRRRALDAFAPRLSRDALVRARAATTGIGDAFHERRARVELLRALAPLVRGPELLDLARGGGWRTGHALAAVAPWLPGPSREAALTHARGIAWADDRAAALLALAAAEPAGSDSAAALAREALAAILAIDDAGDRAERLAALLAERAVTAALDPSSRRDAEARLLETMGGLARAAGRAYSAVLLVPRVAPLLGEASLRALLGVIAAIPDPWQMTQALAAAAPHLPERPLRRLAVLSRIADPAGGAPPADREAAARAREAPAALLAARTAGEPAARIAALCAFAERSGHASARLSDEAMQAALALALSLPEPAARAAALRTVAARLEPFTRDAARQAAGEPEAPDALRRELRAAEAGAGEGDGMALLTLVPALPSPLVPSALYDLVRRLPRDEGARVLVACVDGEVRRHLSLRDVVGIALAATDDAPPPAFVAAIGTALTRDGADPERGAVLAAMAAHLPTDVVHDAWLRLDASRWSDESLRVLRLLAERPVDAPVRAHGRWGALHEAVAEGPRAALLQGLGALAPLIGALGGRQALEGALNAVDHTTTWWP